MSETNSTRRRVAIEAAAIAAAAVIGIWIGEGGQQRRVIGVVLVVVIGIVLVISGTSGAGAARHRGRMRAVLVSTLIVGGAGMARSASEWRAVDHVRVGPFAGDAIVIGESQAVGRGRRVILEIQGQRFESWVFGSLRHRIGRLEDGDTVLVDGQRFASNAGRARRLHVRHVVGRFEIADMRTSVEERSSALARAANRVRRLVSEGADDLPAERAALFSGLVYGDDSSQSAEMTANFRASGLAHLTAVSGQNVVFVLTMVGPVLSRLRRATRIGSTIIVLVWFAIMTRLEPSVVRAVFMAGISIVMVGLGRPVSSWISLCAAVGVATLFDPFLVWSVGWWLSVAGCVGLIGATPAVAHVIGRRRSWLASWIAPTVAAQTGVLAVTVAVFGWPSAVAVPCNLLAAPVAGAVMLVGLPIAVVSGLLPDSIGHMVMWPIGAGVAWVDRVARLGARIDLPTPVDMAASLYLVWVTARAWVHARRDRADFASVVRPGVPSL